MKRTLKVYTNGEETQNINCFNLKSAVEKKNEIKDLLSDEVKKCTKFRIIKI